MSDLIKHNINKSPKYVENRNKLLLLNMLRRFLQARYRSQGISADFPQPDRLNKASLSSVVFYVTQLILKARPLLRGKQMHELQAAYFTVMALSDCGFDDRSLQELEDKQPGRETFAKTIVAFVNKVPDCWNYGQMPQLLELLETWQLAGIETPSENLKFDDWARMLAENLEVDE